MRKPITFLLKLAEKFESGELAFDMGEPNLCIIGQANRELFGSISGQNTYTFAKTFGIEERTVYRIYMGRWNEVLGGNFKNQHSLDLVTRRQAARFIRAFVKKVQTARKVSKINRAKAIRVSYGKVTVSA
jgi:hypothetical protein